MKPASRAEMRAGPDAWSRFQEAIKDVVRVPKTAVVPKRKKSPPKKKRGHN